MMEDNKDSAAKQQSNKIKTIDDAIETPIGETPNLPQDIIEEILVRLPAKSLLKFRCVAKSWLSLISSPKFIKTHLRYSTLDPNSANYRLLLGVPFDPARDNADYDSFSSAVCDLFTDDVVDDTGSPNMPTEYQFKVMSSCNGLLCVKATHHDHNRMHYFLWNPCLRVLKKFPPVAALRPEWILHSNYGIGYDEPNDDYKIVGIFYCARNVAVGGVHKPEVETYVLKNDSWKRINVGFEGATGSEADVIYANGKFHFKAYFEGDRWSIASLDLENEVYGTVEEPKYKLPEYDDVDTNMSLGVLKGCISALYSYAIDYADFWVQKEYGVKESWTKLVSIPYVGLSNPSEGLFSYATCTLWNGKYLFVRRHQLAVYDPEDSILTFLLRPRIGNLYTVTSTGIYAESLVPLPM